MRTTRSAPASLMLVVALVAVGAVGCSSSGRTPTTTSDEQGSGSVPASPAPSETPSLAASATPTATESPQPSQTATPDPTDETQAADSPTIRRLTLPDGAPGDHLGESVDVHAATVVAGAPSDDGGAVAVFYARAGERLDLATVLEPPTTDASGFGHRVAVRSDVIAVTESAAAKVHLYHRREGSWGHTATLAAPDGATDGFGSSLAVGADLVVVGSPPVPERPDPGKAFVFAPLQGAPWGHVDTLEAPQSNRSAAFAHSVDITGGGTVVVGAPSTIGDPGAVHVYEDAAGYRHAATLTASDEAEFSRFGATVAAWSAPGSAPWLAVGAPGHDAAAEQAGRVYRYQRTADGAWTETGTIEPPSGRDPSHRSFGISLDLAGPEILAVGAFGPRDATAGPRDGPGYVHVTLPDRTLVLDAPATTDSSFGAPVALSDGLIAVGAPAEADRTGAVYVGFLR